MHGAGDGPTATTTPRGVGPVGHDSLCEGPNENEEIDITSEFKKRLPATSDPPPSFPGSTAGSLGSGSGGANASDINEVATRTLSGADPTVSAKHQFYLDRKAQKKNKEGTKFGKDKDKFLSGLPEVEADVRYRFTFMVVGSDALDVVHAACNSQEANKLPRAAVDGTEEDLDTLSPGDSVAARAGRSQRPPSYRCLCKVTCPVLDKDKSSYSGNPLLAKLVFQSLGIDQDIPRCSTHYEALTTVIAFTINVGVDMKQLKAQLQALSEKVDSMRSQTRSRLRPVRAVILTMPRGENEAALNEEWANVLFEHEQASGGFWKFGPLDLSDPDSFHATFTEMCSQRIAHNQTGGQELNEPGDDERAQEERETEALLKEGGLAQGNMGVTRHGSDSSTCSEGFQRPPIFEAEVDGSECSDGAVELHARVFGVQEAAEQDA